MDGVDYSSGATPDKYRCGTCLVTGVKLWREYQTMDPGLFCATCAARDQGKDIYGHSGRVLIDDAGYHYEYDSVTDTSERTMNIGNLVPAIPDEEGMGYWGYSSVPIDAANWWRQLPTQE